ncbi:cardiolipin synthase [Dysosmobacter acutus]
MKKADGVVKKGSKRQRVERHISAALRILMVCLTLLLQIAVVLGLAFATRRYSTVIYLIMELIALVCAVGVLNRGGSPSYKISWILLILAVPVAGMILYILWGGTHQAKQLSLKYVPLPVERQSARMESSNNIARLSRALPTWERLATYLEKRGFLLYRNTEVRYFREGADFFADLITTMEKAQNYIFLEYYILAEGKLWDRIFEVLRQRSAAGVEIKIIFDDFGNITRLSDAMLQQIQDAGIQVQIFNPVHKYVNRLYFNYRDHRKIAVIDGWSAYTGGLNIADEYANIINRLGHWKDTGVCLRGEGAWGLTSQFVHMWEMLGGTLDNEHDYYRPESSGQGGGFCQCLCDGPMNNPDNPAEETYLQLISNARRFLYMTTPYLAIEESMVKALCIAGDGGVDVRLMVPAIPDHKFTYLVAETYYGQLMAHGVKIYKYSPGFLHSKTVMVDREVALVGSINMDYRSFQLHYECGVLLYDVPAVEEIFEDMDNIVQVSARYTQDDWNKRPWYRKAMETVLKLFAIWM